MVASNQISGKKALITGSSAGLGAEFARQLAETNDLILVARDKIRLEEISRTLKKKSNTNIQIIPADLTKPGELAKVEDYVRSEKSLGLVVNNAGFGTVGRFHELDIEAETRQIQLNITALTRLTHAALTPMLAAGGGQIVNVASVAGLMPAPFSAVYGATKSFVADFTRSLAEEYSEDNIRFQALCPGLTYTEFHQRGDIDTSNLPSFVWMRAAEVVKQSLTALEKPADSDPVLVPGLANKMTASLAGLIPHGLFSRLTREIMSRTMMRDDKSGSK